MGHTPWDNLMPVSEELQAVIEEERKKKLVKYLTILDQSMGQIIFYGPPGTGKTFVAKEIAQEITDASGEVWTTSTHRKIVQFHQSYSYEDFVQGIKPKKDDGGSTTFALQPGIFQKFCQHLNTTTNTGGDVPDGMSESIALILLREEERGGTTLTIDEIHTRLKNGHKEHKYDSLHKFTGNEKYQYGVVNHRCHDFWEHGNPSRPAPAEDWWFEHTRGTGDWKMNKKCPSYEELKKRFANTGEVETDTKKRVLIIDEINRGNLSKIFGELIYGLEYRDEEIDLQYKQFDPDSDLGVLSIPKFVKIIGTMNTADRSIILFDAALRRRFSFIPLFPDYNLLAQSLNIARKFDELEFKNRFATATDQELKNSIMSVLALWKINHALTEDHSIGREKQIGHTFLIGKNNLHDFPEKFVKVWKHEIIPLLEEYYFERPIEITLMFGNEIFEKSSGIGEFNEEELIKALEKYTELVSPAPEPEAEPTPEL
jgi:DNA polymerase III delta prime subunit